MSSNEYSLGIAAVTVTLADKLAVAVEAVMPGAVVTTLSPATEMLASGEPFINVYLFCIRANDLRRTLPDPGQHERADSMISVDLDYMITFFGDDSRRDSQRLAGLVVGALHANSVITAEELQRTCATIPRLTGIDAANVGPVRLMSNWLSADAALSVFGRIAPGTPYRLSLFCTASGVLL